MDSSQQSDITFVHLSRPIELKDQKNIDYVRRKATSYLGDMIKKSPTGGRKTQVVFEFAPSGIPPSNGVALSRVGLETLDPFASCPFTLDAYASQLCTYIFGSNEGHSFELRTAWSFVGFHDELSFQTVLSNAVLYGQILRSGTRSTEDSVQSLQLHNKALNMIHERLKDPEQHTSDSVIGSMSGFLTHDYVVGDFEGWSRHMKGLLEMIELRGGVETFNHEQLHITLSWTDICGSYSQDIPPQLPAPASWLQAIALPHCTDRVARPIFMRRPWGDDLPQAQSWKSTFDLLTSLIADPDKPPNKWMEPIIHRLLSLRPIQSDSPPTPDLVIEEVCRLGALLFLASIWRSFGIHPVRTTRIRQNLLMVLTGHLVEWGQLRVLLLWTLAHATREAAQEGEREAFAIRLAMVMRKMELSTWKEAVQQVRAVLWADAYEESWDSVDFALQKVVVY